MRVRVRQLLLLLLLLMGHSVLVLTSGQPVVDNGGGGDGGGGGGSDATSVVGEPTEDGQQRWECPRPGRFPNPADPSCRTYLTCAVVPGTNGSLAVPRQDECWQGALFSGRYQRCITGDDCATLEDFYAIEYECGPECGKYVLESSTDCRHFVNCLKTKDPGVFVPIRQRCPDDRPRFSPTARGCVPEDEYECGDAPPAAPLPSLLTMTTTTTTTQVTQAVTTTTTPQPSPLPRPSDATDHRHLSDLVCLGEGRFPDESVPHCRGYRLCTPVGASAAASGAAPASLVSRSFLCDPGTVFSEYERRCVPAATYQCPDDAFTTTEGGAGASFRFRCVTVGRFPDRESRGCVRFYRCQRDGEGGAFGPPVLEQCPPGTSFSWLTTRCVPSAEYVCPVGPALPATELLGTPPAPEAAAGSTSTSTSSRCVRSGRFANEADATCRTYYICTRDQHGAWALVLIRCPAGTVFSRTVAHCVGSESSSAAVAGQQCQQPVRCSNGENVEDDDDVAGSGRGPIGAGADCVAEPALGATGESVEQTGGGGGSGGELEPAPDVGLGLAPWLTWSATEPLTADASTLDGGDLVLVPSALRPYTPPEYPCTATGRFADINSVDCRSYFLCKLHQPTQAASDRPAPAESPNHHSKQHHHQQQHQQQQQILVSVHMTCPDGMLFSRNTNKCVISNRHVC